MRGDTWTIQVNAKELNVLTRNMDAMHTVLREQDLNEELADDFHQCIETLGGIVEKIRRADER